MLKKLLLSLSLLLILAGALPTSAATQVAVRIGPRHRRHHHHYRHHHYRRR